MRIGEFAIGTNLALSSLIGNMLQDEKFPGVHIAFGSPLSAETGAAWESCLHVDCVLTRTSIFVDGESIMHNGKFTEEFTAA